MRRAYTVIIIFCLILASCAELGEMVKDTVKTLDYTKLYEIAYQLASSDKQENITGLNALVGSENTHKLLSWYNGTKLAWEAGKAILDGVKSRDVLVTQVINQYQRGQ